MSRFTLSRRAVLRGASGVAVGLPALEIMAEGTARAAAPKRFLFCYAGLSLCTDGIGQKRWAPKATGANYPLEGDLSPLGRFDRTNAVRTFKGYDIQNDVTVVSGLKIPWAEEYGGNTPPAGLALTLFHGSTAGPMLCGTSSSGPSAENLVGSLIGKGTRFKALQLQIQAQSYESGYNQRGEISVELDSGGRAVPKSFTASPQAAFKSIFRGAPLPTAGLTEAQKQAQKDAQQRLLNREKSLLDLVLRRSDRLRARLGKTDLVRLERHFDEIRALETRVTQIPDLSAVPLCAAPADPGSDPSLDPTTNTVNSGEGGPRLEGWAGEDKRGQAMVDLMYMALTCDLARAGSLLITYAQSFLKTKDITGSPGTVHDSTHDPGKGPIDDVLAWHVEFFAKLASLLKKTPDIDGTPMLDNTVMIMGTEGGCGFDHTTGNPVSAHSSENMSMLIAGGRALGLKPGRHIAKNNTAHPASVVRSGMKAVGIDVTLGVTKTDLPELSG